MEEDSSVDGQAHPLKKLKFSRHKHVRPGSSQPQVDDVVEFNVAFDKVRGSKRAKNVNVIAEAPNELSMQGRDVVRTLLLASHHQRAPVPWRRAHLICMQGHVIRVSEEGGEIRALESADCIDFHSDGCSTAGTFSRLTCKCEVSYSVARAPGGHRYAKEIKLLPPGVLVTVFPLLAASACVPGRACDVPLRAGTITAKEALGITSGMVERMPSVNTSLATDGLISYTRNGQAATVGFGLQDIHEFLPCLHAGDEVRPVPTPALKPLFRFRRTCFSFSIIQTAVKLRRGGTARLVVTTLHACSAAST